MANIHDLTPQEVLNKAFDSINNVLKTSTTVQADIQIGAVELKNDTTDDRAKVKTASTVAEADMAIAVKDPSIGVSTDAEASGNGGVVALLKRLRTLLSGGFPAALSAGGGLKAGLVDAIPAGTANIGDVDVLTMPTTNVKTAAGDEVAIRKTLVDPLLDDGTASAIKYIKVEATTDGDNTVIAAVAGKKLRVLGYSVQVVTTAGILKFQDSAVTPVVFAEFDGALKDKFTYDGGLDAPAFETASGLGLEINVGTGVDVKGHLTYIEA